MSGRSLFSLSLNVAKKLSDAFDGRLPISYSGGADYFNLEEILAAGIRPVTLATNILKPGGYERLSQLAELAEKVLRDMHLNAHNDPINMKALRGTPPDAHNAPVKVKALGALAASLPHRSRYRKEYRQTGSRKTTTKLPLFDCFKAPCMDGGCPINQRIPDYLAAAAEGNYPGAFKIIARDNTAPSITGTICDHQCQHKCTRVDYEDPLRIRAAKLASAENAQDDFSASLEASALKTEESAAIIGAGPAGIAAAVFLRRNGVAATVYERRNRPFGIVQHVIPAFRISDEAIYRDFRMVEKTGVEFLFDAPERYSLAELQKKHRFVVIATGAWKEGDAPVKEGAENVIDALRFLEDSKKSKCTLELGKRVAVIGGGDVAMDCARAAKRNRGVESVSLVYRRTREFMPSQFEEQEAALAEGVEILELLAPLSFIDGALDCEVMRLGAYDLSFRRSIEGTGEKKKLMFDTVIGAVGARVDTGLFAANGIALNDKGLPAVNAARESSLAGVYIAGDCKAGPATVVKAIADGKAAALDILRKLGIRADFDTAADDRAGNTVKSPDFSDLYLKKGIIAEAGPDSADAYRCLSCNTLCEICADVCPNRANVMIETGKGGLEQNFGSAQGLSQGSVQGLAPLSHQIVHIDRICNECGNCAVFCPHSGKPYRDKFTIFSGEEHFADSENSGFFRTGPDTYKIRLEDKSVLNYRRGEKNIPDTWLAMIETIETQYAYLII
jgi:putative selenate reductase